MNHRNSHLMILGSHPIFRRIKRDKKIFTTNAIIHMCEERYETVEISKLEGIIEAILFTMGNRLNFVKLPRLLSMMRRQRERSFIR